ncbi:class I SAM-dependent methyltransferase [Affinibrenneria salicis]|uniref:Class I SAM-dependent methyltransferase n=1 Tax=Affinibrenneria salicis TaxID=2590031 RepID=A0A5J5FSK9_9GAMM|nr:class I SAM-dependent methyltransferase [Affinibrenneria salicis]KAA8996362.1 class I SAM-dependent methyltransferase [Affinibrenneria salicis]
MDSVDDDKMFSLAQQLRQPHGAGGIQIGQLMHESNIGMTRACFSSLQAAAGDRLLEIGHGNAAHVADLFRAQPALRYQGLETSTLMQEEAQRLNPSLAARGLARFTHYAGERFPFDEQTFDKVMTVNTLYFQARPDRFLAEVCRVLKPGARFSLAFVPADFMRELPFVQYGFTLFGVEEARLLLGQAALTVEGVDMFEESVSSKSEPGATTLRPFIVIRALKDGG